MAWEIGQDLYRVRANQTNELPIHQTEVERHHPILGLDCALSRMEPMPRDQTSCR